MNPMPKIDLATLPLRVGSGYPEPFSAACAERTRQRLVDPDDLMTCSDSDMMSYNRDGRFVRKDGTPFP